MYHSCNQDIWLQPEPRTIEQPRLVLQLGVYERLLDVTCNQWLSPSLWPYRLKKSIRHATAIISLFRFMSECFWHLHTHIAEAIACIKSCERQLQWSFSCWGAQLQRMTLSPILCACQTGSHQMSWLKVGFLLTSFPLPLWDKNIALIKNRMSFSMMEFHVETQEAPPESVRGLETASGDCPSSPCLYSGHAH